MCWENTLSHSLYFLPFNKHIYTHSSDHHICVWLAHHLQKSRLLSFEHFLSNGKIENYFFLLQLRFSEILSWSLQQSCQFIIMSKFLLYHYVKRIVRLDIYVIELMSMHLTKDENQISWFISYLIQLTIIIYF